MKKVVAIGEVMVEFSPAPQALLSEPQLSKEFFALSFAGDTFNAAVYMARLGLSVDYFTRLGDDLYSKKILARIQEESIGAQWVERLPGRCPGLYIINNKPDGEHEFFYWRRESPAREMFFTQSDTEVIAKKLENVNAIYFSGITLAIIYEQAREHFFWLLKKLRERNITIAFDINYRPRLWPSKEVARQFIQRAIELSDMVLLTLDDERLLWGDASVETILQRYRHNNMRDLVIKRGAEPTLIITQRTRYEVPVPTVGSVVDTTGAGDSFNAGYLASRLNGGSAVESATQAIRVAALVIQHRGAIVDKKIFNDYFKR